MLNAIGSILGEGWMFATKAPRRVKVRADYGYAERCAKERRATLVEDSPRRQRVRFIHLKFFDQHYGSWYHASIAVDTEKRRIEPGATSMWLLGREHQGSGGIAIALCFYAIMLVTFPISIPLVCAADRLYRRSERKHGMSVHGIALLKALEGQLTPEDEALLREALRNAWAREQALNREVSLEEAKRVLAQCSLCETVLPAGIIYDTESRQFHWHDDAGECLGRGSFCGERDHDVSVLGSSFDDDEADQLIACFRTRELLVYDKKEGSFVAAP